jgi:hypothetical protein
LRKPLIERGYRRFDTIFIPKEEDSLVKIWKAGLFCSKEDLVQLIQNSLSLFPNITCDDINYIEKYEQALNKLQHTFNQLKDCIKDIELYKYLVYSTFHICHSCFVTKIDEINLTKFLQERISNLIPGSKLKIVLFDHENKICDL